MNELENVDVHAARTWPTFRRLC